MKILSSMLLMMALSFCASAADLNGTWKAVFTGDPAQWPKGISQVHLDIRVVGSRLVGTARVGNWMTDGPLVDGAIDGDRFTFTVFGNYPWRSSGPMGSASGLPMMKFTGTMEGNEMKLTLFWDSVMIEGPKPPGRELPMAAKRI